MIKHATIKQRLQSVSLRKQVIVLWVLASALILGGSLTHQEAYAIARGDLNHALLATVQVVVPVADEEDTYSTGSGTVISEDGLILTNYHVMGEIEDRTLYNENGFAGIAVNPTNLRGSPILRYAALLVAGDPDLDLALLRIVGLLEDTDAPLPENLGLTVIEVGDSEAVQIGDEINAFGFPSIGGDTVTFTSGTVSGFLDEDKDGYSEWLKVDLNINHGNSGGLATNELGEMIGVPTAGITDLGMIGLVRDGNLAMDFVKRALLSPQNNAPRDANAAYVSNVQFAKAIDSRGRPRNPGVRFNSGVDTIYATFDYGNFPANGEFEFHWFHDGFRIYNDLVVWTYGDSGSTWVNVYDDNGLEDGFYEVEISVDGEELYRGGAVIGAGRALSNGTFGPITFAAGVDDNDEPINPGTVFSDIDEIYAFFDVDGVENGAQWTRRWYLDGEVVSEQDSVWNAGNMDATWISLYADDGLPPGEFTLELLIEDEIVQSASMEVAESGASQPTERGVIVNGTVTAADNRGRPIQGAAIYFLNPGVLVDDFLDDPQDADIYASGTSDRDGFYQLDRNLTPGELYSVVVFKEGYRLVAVDDYQIDPDATSPWTIDVTMEQR
ncbi:MAG: trypsin-like peptidase domain-containing protein, partial [Caldilineaceae bacterium]|nr:trypsin-like peptidase domain-containing protein [Caldilineaceae bacterium]